MRTCLFQVYTLYVMCVCMRVYIYVCARMYKHARVYTRVSGVLPTTGGAIMDTRACNARALTSRCVPRAHLCSFAAEKLSVKRWTGAL